MYLRCIVPFASSYVDVSSEVDLKRVILREVVQAVEEFLIALEGYNPGTPAARIVVRFGEESGFYEVEFPSQVVTGSKPIHKLLRLKAGELPAEVHREGVLRQEHLLCQGYKPLSIQLNVRDRATKFFDQLKVRGCEGNQPDARIPTCAGPGHAVDPVHVIRRESVHGFRHHFIKCFLVRDFPFQVRVIGVDVK